MSNIHKNEGDGVNTSSEGKCNEVKKSNEGKGNEGKKSNVTTLSILKIFKDSLIKFLNDILFIFPDDGNLITASVMIRDFPDFERLMKNFVADLLPLKERVKNRDENYLLSNEPKIYKKIVEDFKYRWRKNIINKENKQKIWKWGDIFIKIGDSYLKIKEKESLSDLMENVNIN